MEFVARTAVVGTVGYMSPEQVRGEAADPRSDVFSLGAVLYELLCGQRAFQRGSAVETLHAILHDAPPDFAAARGKTSPALERVVRRCLEKRPEDRYQSADQVAAALGECQDAGPMSLPSLLAELSRRRVFRALVAYGIAAFAVLQIIEPIMHGLHWPDRVLSYVVVALGLGFPIVVSLAWIFDVRAGRIERTAPVAPASGLRGVRLAAVLVGVGVLAAAPGAIYFFAVRKPAPPSSTPASIAVLPFVNMSSDKETDYFSDGITEELINALVKVDGLRVIARTSSFSFKGKTADLRAVGRQLGAAHLLEGSVRKEGNRIRITAQLIAAADGVHLWSQTFDRDLTSVLALQEEIAHRVASKLERKLIPARARAAAPSPEVLDQVLLGRHFLLQGWPDGFGRSVTAYEKAVALDPGYAPAWAGLALARHRFANDGRTLPEVQAARQKAFETADRAIALDPELAPAFANRGWMRLTALDWVGAESDLQRALLLEPGNAEVQSSLAALHTAFGHLPEAIRFRRKAAELDPLNASTWGMLARLLAADGQVDPALVVARRGVEIAPGGVSPAFALGIVELVAKKPAEALAVFAKIEEKDVYAPIGTALALHDLGRQREAEEALSSVERCCSHVASYCIAWVHAWWGDKDAAFSALERSREQQESGLYLLKADPLLRGLRGDPRYAALLARLKLPPD